MARRLYNRTVAIDKIVWIDCEMTGLDVGRDELIEVAAIVTDFDLTPADDGVDVIIRPSDQARTNMNEFVTAMHTESGLIDELDSGVSVDEATAQVMAYITKHVPEPKKAPLGGNSVGTDKMFLAAQMPQVVDYLHYRIIDVSSVKELAKRWYPRAYFKSPEKKGGHRALGDILDSIFELNYYRKLIFVDDVTSADVEAVAQEMTTKRASMREGNSTHAGTPGV